MAAPRLTALRYYYCDVSGPYPILEPSTELNPARISFFFKGAKEMSPPAANSLSSSPHQELPGDDRGSNPPAVAGRLFFTIRPGRLSLPSVAYEFTSIPGWVQFPFDFSLVAVTRIRASVSTPPKLT
ncbi:hypothetical protein CR513_01608, partial [Mucuna pruriens]